MRERFRHVSQALDLGGHLERHLRENIGLPLRIADLAARPGRIRRELLPAGKVILGPLRLRQWPVAASTPFVGAHHPVANRRFIHDTGLDTLQPVVIPTNDLVVVLMEWPFQMSRPREKQLAWLLDVPEVVLGA